MPDISKNLLDLLGIRPVRPRNNDLGEIARFDREEALKMAIIKRMDAIDKRTEKGLPVNKQIAQLYAWAAKKKSAL